MQVPYAACSLRRLRPKAQTVQLKVTGMERVVVRNDGQVQPDRLHRRRVRRPDQGPEPRHRLHQRARDRHQPHGQGEADRTGVPPGHVPLFHHVLSQGRRDSTATASSRNTRSSSSFSAQLHPYRHANGEGNYQWNTGYELSTATATTSAAWAMSTSSFRPPTPTDRSCALSARTSTIAAIDQRHPTAGQQNVVTQAWD